MKNHNYREILFSLETSICKNEKLMIILMAIAFLVLSTVGIILIVISASIPELQIGAKDTLFDATNSDFKKTYIDVLALSS